MIRQSEVANFLDLIQHITQARNFKNSHSPFRPKIKRRYDEPEYETENEQNQRKVIKNSQYLSQTQQNQKISAQFEHKMLKITHEIKRKPKSFKFDTFEGDKVQSHSYAELNAKINQSRSNLYENYCEMIQKKRQEKINKMFRNSQNDINQSICNISDAIKFDDNKNSRSFKQAPFMKSKTSKPGFQPIKFKTDEKSKKKVHPQQLNIETVKSVKMPKLTRPTSNKKMKINVQIYASSHEKKISINKGGNLEGWLFEEEKNPFHVDYF